MELALSFLQKVWWHWTPGNPSGFSVCYHWFNIVEGTIWIVVAGLVLRRFETHRRSRIEPLYGGLFFLFAATDFAEAWQQSTWLIAVKLVILLLLWRVRRLVLMYHYPNARGF